MDVDQFETFILIPALKAINLYSFSAHILLLGTFLIESGLRLIEQLGPGDAMGIGQIEEATYQDVLRYLNRYDKAKLKEICLAACFYTAFPPRSSVMHNFRWATITTRLKYLPIPEPLPAWDDSNEMANYHKSYYNTSSGKTDVKESIRVFESIAEQRRDKLQG
jgi:hypothetical protein